MTRATTKQFLDEVLPKKIPIKKQVYDYLLRKGEDGASTTELKSIDHRFGSSIHQLRLEGHVIDTYKLREGYAIYYYIGFDKNKQEHRKPIEVIVEEIVNNYNGKVSANELLSILERRNYIIKGK